jgi:hypothetical protein
VNARRRVDPVGDQGDRLYLIAPLPAQEEYAWWVIDDLLAIGGEA